MSGKARDHSSSAQLTTVGLSPEPRRPAAANALGLTIAQHPDLSRVGETIRLATWGEAGEQPVSRLEPEFVSSEGVVAALGTPLMSRRPFLLRAAVGNGFQVSVDPAECSSQIWIAGKLLTEPCVFDEEQLQRGVAIELAQCIVLLLHQLAAAEVQGPDTQLLYELGLDGQSPSSSQLRDEISRVADLDTCVLLRGESGSGKELVARALHRLSPRAERSFSSVNVAAIAPSVAVASLFGHRRGAFTGATEASPGYFKSSDGGTLFLDEIGDVPRDVQPLLLRALREGEIQPVGESRTRKVDVRVLAATDADLEGKVQRGEFAGPLLRRLEGYTLFVPPLRKRPDDIARLFVRFLREELLRLGEEGKLESRAGRPWLPTACVALLLEYDFPGNVAELQTWARHVAIGNRGRSDFTFPEQLVPRLRQAGLGARVERLGRDHRRAAAADSAPTGGGAPFGRSTRHKSARELSDEELVAALREHRFEVKSAAESLGVSRSWLSARMDSCAGIRKANTLSREEIVACFDDIGGELATVALRLEVSEHGLKLRLSALGLRAPSGAAGGPEKLP